MQKITFCAVVLSILALFGSAANTLSSELAQVTGTLTYPQHIVLPSDAVIHLSLVDVSPRQDASGDVIAKQTIKSPGQIPIPFKLKYNPSRIRPTHLYAIQARITAHDGLRLVNTSPYPVITQGNPQAVDVSVSSVN